MPSRRQQWNKNLFCILRPRDLRLRPRLPRTFGLVLIAAATGICAWILLSHVNLRARAKTTATTVAFRPLSVSRVSSSALVAPTRRILQKQALTGESPEFERAMRFAVRLQMEPRRDDAAESEVRQLSKNLKKAELSELSAVALNEETNANRRNAAIFILIMAGDHAMEQLAEVVTQPVHPFPEEQFEHSRGSLQKKYEVALRVRALEELDRLTMSSPPDVKKETVTRLSRIVAQQNQPTLQFLAQLSLQGVREGRPGKLNRFEEKAFTQGKKQ